MFNMDIKRLSWLFLSQLLFFTATIQAELSLEMPHVHTLYFIQDDNLSTDAEIDDLFMSIFIGLEDGTFVLDDPSTSSDESEVDAELAISGDLLNYPNPFSVSKTGTSITYELNKAADVELHIYSLDAYLVYSDIFQKGNQGALSGYNNVSISSSEFKHFSPGAYLYVILSDGKVLAKNKMVVLP